MTIEYIVVSQRKQDVEKKPQIVRSLYKSDEFQLAVDDFNDIKDKTELNVELKLRIITGESAYPTEFKLQSRGTISGDLPF